MTETVRVNIEADLGRIQTIAEKLSRNTEIAINDAYKRATVQTKNWLIKKAQEKINLPKGRIEDGLRVNQMGGEIMVLSRAPTLTRFIMPRARREGGFFREPKRKGLRAKLWKDRPAIEYPGTFLAYGKGGNLLVMKRVDDGSRSKLKALHGRWLRDLWEIPSFQQGLDEFASSAFRDRFNSTLERLNR